MFRSLPIIDRFIQFFSLPSYCLNVLKIKECNKTRIAIAVDLLQLFFSYKTFPDNYVLCRLFEVPKSEWKYYYGSNYQSYQRARIKRKVQQEKFRILFNDKAVCEQLCRYIGIRTPYTYGIVRPDEKYKEKILSWCQKSPKGVLIIKPLYGRAGLGIVLAKKFGDDVIIKSTVKSIPIYDYILETDALVQELVIQDERMAVFSSHSVNTIRVNSMFTNNASIILLGAQLRCGIGEAYIDNFSAGGVTVGIDCINGRLNKYAMDNKGNKYVKHPKSNIVFEDFIIPEWNRIVETTEKIQKAFSFYCLLGVDIALQESGDPIVIEVNASPDLSEEVGPLLKNKKNLKAFGEYDLLINKHQKKLYNNLNQISAIDDN